MKRIALKLTFSLGLGLLLIEGLFSVLAYVKYGTLNLNTIDEFDTGNSYTTELRQLNASLAEVCQPHPYLGIVPDISIRDANWNNNDVANFPRVRDTSKFTILLTGTSAAQMFGSLHYLEDILNQSRALGTRDVVVLNAAMGATRQPRPAVALMLYGDAADAILNLDGYNEQTATITGRLAMEAPAREWFVDQNPVLAGGFDGLTRIADARRLQNAGVSCHSRCVYFVAKMLRDRVMAGHQDNETWKESYRLPEDWSLAQRNAFNIGRYKKYLRLMHADAGVLRLKEAYFIQPTATTGKTLTAGELRVVGDTSKGDAYRKVTDELVSLNDEGIPVVSLLDVFAETTETIYADPVHCAMKGNENPGCRILAERIATECARLWQSDQ